MGHAQAQKNNCLCDWCSVGKKCMKSTRRVVGQMLHLLICSHRSFIRMLCTARYACASATLILSLARSLTHSGAYGREYYVYELNALISYSFNPYCDGLLKVSETETEKKQVECSSNHRYRVFLIK